MQQGEDFGPSLGQKPPLLGTLAYSAAPEGVHLPKGSDWPLVPAKVAPGLVRTLWVS